MELRFSNPFSGINEFYDLLYKTFSLSSNFGPMFFDKLSTKFGKLMTQGNK